ncbi:secondary thiamine-phosphate synthase enzyme YjbQ [Marinobacterium lutimaris]|uniref:Secondary thiamine-phosphate synthase enzyme n=1 Tax=Marinobacterium lutimaris TaxID=568106 RepID=A0A1H5XHV1_9GAMM|nr:secondary thiamine-phosphate synthase enzyme YjbQ [Marinobacterium lutimaris]SEG11302.1 secondary thiamine-phosphate synthase enzyme [Marinobacterium lutimaris]
MAETLWYQQVLTLKARRRGFHLITDEIERELSVQLGRLDCGLLHLFLQHTSASLTINENADPTVRQDFESHFTRAVPEQPGLYRHDYEGPDDMPAHIKSSILGPALTIPVSRGRLALGTWQGMYLCEHRDHAGARRIVATLTGSV